MRNNNDLTRLIAGLDPAAAMPETTAGADDSVPRRIMADQDRYPSDQHLVTGVSPHWRTVALVAGGLSIALAITLMITATGGSGGWPTVPAGNPVSNPFEYVRLELTGDAPAPLVNGLDACQSQANQQIQQGVDGPEPPTGPETGSSEWPGFVPSPSPGPVVDPSGPPPGWTPPSVGPTDPWPSPSVGEGMTRTAGVIWVNQDAEYPVEASDDHTVVLHGPDGRAAATLTDLGPDVPQVEVRDTTGAVIGAIDYAADGGNIQVYIDSTGVVLSAGGVPIANIVGRNGSPGIYMMGLSWSSLLGVVVNSATPTWFPSFSPTETQVLPLVLSVSDGQTVFAIFSSSAGTITCQTLGNDGPAVRSDVLGVEPAPPYAASLYSDASLILVPRHISDGKSVAWGTVGTDVSALALNFQDGTSVQAQIAGGFWVALHDDYHADGPNYTGLDPVSLTVTLTDGRTHVISV